MTAARTMYLDELLDGFAAPVPRVSITGVHSDSRQLRPGDLFAAVPGIASNGVDYLPAAVRAGAAAAVWDGPVEPASDLPLLRVPDLARRLGAIASRFHGEPSQHLFLVGITGTDGKTSCAHILAQALAHMDCRCSYMGTLGIGFPEHLVSATHTTPSADAVQRNLAVMRAAGAAAVAMEVSSHALEQFRVDGCSFDTAVLTNLGRDHLDYHGSMENYAAAKRRLFTMPGLKAAVFNTDDAVGLEWASEHASRAGFEPEVVAYGLSRPSLDGIRNLFARDVELLADGLRIDIDGSWGRMELRSRLLGRFNVYNLLASLAVLLLRGIAPERAVAALAEVKPVPGRMQRLESTPAGPSVVVDYAHTPNALEAALTAARGHGAGRLICVFGCGGDRDRGKRPLMAAAAERLADELWVTSDNPRREQPEAIIEEVLAGLENRAVANVRVDRQTAIEAAIRAAGPDDLVLIAGKGHEDYQVVGDTRLHFDDREAALQALARL